MSRVERRLRVLVQVFVVWFVAQGLLGTWMAYRVLSDRWSTSLVVAFQGPTLGIVLTSAVLAEAALLALGIVLFQAVQHFRRGARCVLLAVAWVSAASAAAGLLAAPAVPFAAVRPSIAGVLANCLSLAYWAWTIAMLQFDGEVRKAFFVSAA